MSKLEELVPPLELCKLIPKGEFEDTALVWFEENSPYGWYVKILKRDEMRKYGFIYPATTLQEILEELHKLQEDVFLKWSPKAYHSWLINAYTHDKEDYQDHDNSAVTAALKLWLKLKGIEYEK